MDYNIMERNYRENFPESWWIESGGKVWSTSIKGPFGYSWKLKLKTEKYYSKKFFECVNSIMGPIFNEKVAEKWNLWVCEQCTVCTDRLKRGRKVKLCSHCSCTVHDSAWTVAASLMNACKKKKKKKEKRQTQMLGFSAQSKRSLSRKNWGL